MSEVLTTRREGGILEVTLDRPKANAINLATSREMGKSSKAFVTTPNCVLRSSEPRVTSFSVPAGT